MDKISTKIEKTPVSRLLLLRLLRHLESKPASQECRKLAAELEKILTEK